MQTETAEPRRYAITAKFGVIGIAAFLASAAVGMMLTHGKGHVRPELHTLSGSFTVWHTTPQENPCVASTTDPLFHDNDRVVVHDERNQVVASNPLGRGAAEVDRRGCTYHFTARALAESGSYTIEVADRGALPYTYAQLEQSKWKVALNLGVAPPSG